MKKLNSIFLIFALSITIISCDKSDNPSDPIIPNYDKQTELAKDYSFAQDAYSDVFDLLCQASVDSALKSPSHSSVIGGANVTYNPATKTYIFNFPSKSTNGKVGNFSAVLDKNGDFLEIGTKAAITFDNYSVGGSLIKGTNNIINKNVSNKNTATGVTYSYTDSIQNSMIIRGTDTIFVNAAYTVDWELHDIFTIDDDQYWYSGNISGYSNPNKSFSAVVPTASRVLVAAACQWIQSGIITATTHTLDENNAPKTTTMIINFGTGCDKQVQITIDGTIATFDM
ncbi:MAG: hypothetical protein ACOYLE_00215 [Bacteroidales bacterium]